MSARTKEEIIADIERGQFTEEELNEIRDKLITKRLKINFITINESGDEFKFMNNSIEPNVELFDGINGIPLNHRMYENNVVIECRTTYENNIFSTVVTLVSLMGTWGYVISERQRNIDELDGSKITNVLKLEQSPRVRSR